MPGRFDGFENQIGYARHGGNYHDNPITLCRIANNSGALAEPLRIAN
jgi:hypothetical protein